MADKQDIARVVAMLQAAFPNWKLSEYTLEVYYMDLRDIPSDLIMVAAQHCRTSTMRDQRFAPSSGEIRAAASDIIRQVQGIPTALEAWGELLHAPKTEEYKDIIRDENDNPIIEIRPYQWSHPLVRKVAVMMGFPRFPDWDSESFERTAFLKAYEMELQGYLKQKNQPEQVTVYVESKKANMLNAGDAVKQLTEGMKK